MNQEKIGKFIADLRKGKKLTQEELAERLVVTDKSVSRWENGKCLPDVSLFKPLCSELDISLNGLLSGEKVSEKEYQEKLEENIVNTIDYSNQKVKRIKFVYSFSTIIICLILLTLLILFGIDIMRMRNNEPVFFSTWGFKYAPPVNFADFNIENVIKKYLIEKDEENKHYENEKSFAAMKIYLINEDLNNHYYVYAWVLQEQYYLEDGKLIRDVGSSIPHKFELVKENDEFIVKNYIIPRDGSYYVKDMKRIFPNSVLRDMDNIHTDGTIERLSLEIENDVNLYFHRFEKKVQATCFST